MSLAVTRKMVKPGDRAGMVASYNTKGHNNLIASAKRPAPPASRFDDFQGNSGNYGLPLNAFDLNASLPEDDYGMSSTEALDSENLPVETNLREQQKVIQHLQKEVFNYKLKLYHLEQQLDNKVDPSSTYKLIDELSERTAENQQLREQLEKSKKLLQDAQRAIEQLQRSAMNGQHSEEERAQLVEQLAVREDEVNRLQHEQSNMIKRLTDFESKLSDREHMLDTYQDEIKQLYSTQEEILQKQIRELHSRNADLQSAYEEQNDERDKIIAFLEKENEDIKFAHQELTDKLRESESVVDNKDDIVQSLEERVSELKNVEKTMQATLIENQELHDRLQTREREFKSLRSDFEELQSHSQLSDERIRMQNAELQTQSASFAARLADATKEMEGIRSQKSDATASFEKEISNWESKLVESQAMIARTQQLLVERDLELQNLRRSVDELKQTLNDSRRENEQFSKRVREQDGKLAEFDVMVARRQHETRQLEQRQVELDTLRRELAEKTEILSKARVQITELELRQSSSTNVSSELELHRKQLREKTQAVADLEHQVAVHRRTTEKLHKQMDDQRQSQAALEHSVRDVSAKLADALRLADERETLISQLEHQISGLQYQLNDYQHRRNQPEQSSVISANNSNVNTASSVNAASNSARNYQVMPPGGATVPQTPAPRRPMTIPATGQNSMSTLSLSHALAQVLAPGMSSGLSSTLNESAQITLLLRNQQLEHDINDRNARITQLEKEVSEQTSEYEQLYQDASKDLNDFRQFMTAYKQKMLRRREMYPSMKYSASATYASSKMPHALVEYIRHISEQLHLASKKNDQLQKVLASTLKSLEEGSHSKSHELRLRLERLTVSYQRLQDDLQQSQHRLRDEQQRVKRLGKENARLRSVSGHLDHRLKKREALISKALQKLQVINQWKDEVLAATPIGRRVSQHVDDMREWMYDASRYDDEDAQPSLDPLGNEYRDGHTSDSLSDDSLAYGRPVPRANTENGSGRPFAPTLGKAAMETPAVYRSSSVHDRR